MCGRKTASFDNVRILLQHILSTAVDEGNAALSQILKKTLPFVSGAL
jgi:hypothetical protein